MEIKVDRDIINCTHTRALYKINLILIDLKNNYVIHINYHKDYEYHEFFLFLYFVF